MGRPGLHDNQGPSTLVGEGAGRQCWHSLRPLLSGTGVKVVERVQGDDHLDLGEWSCRHYPGSPKWQMGIMVAEGSWEEGQPRMPYAGKAPLHPSP